jgi:hypothetical protein
MSGKNDNASVVRLIVEFSTTDLLWNDLDHQCWDFGWVRLEGNPGTIFPFSSNAQIGEAVAEVLARARIQQLSFTKEGKNV